MEPPSRHEAWCVQFLPPCSAPRRFLYFPRTVGKINLCSPDHISLLVHRTFNVSIPRHHITTDSYEFESGPAENDPEFGAGQEKAATDDPAADEGAEESVDGGGRWVHKLTGVKIGDPEGHLEFTVVGCVILTISLILLLIQT